MIYLAWVISSTVTVGGNSILYTPSKHFANAISKTSAL